VVTFGKEMYHGAASRGAEKKNGRQMGAEDSSKLALHSEKKKKYGR